jgi:hypothetical protein
LCHVTLSPEFGVEVPVQVGLRSLCVGSAARDHPVDALTEPNVERVGESGRVNTGFVTIELALAG